jgi:hypothetical protein
MDMRLELASPWAYRNQDRGARFSESLRLGGAPLVLLHTSDLGWRVVFDSSSRIVLLFLLVLGLFFVEGPVPASVPCSFHAHV